MTLLKSRTKNDFLLVANTHLYSQMDAAHIRLLQIGFCMLYIENIWPTVINDLQIDDKRLSLILCGDMNSVPERGVSEFMLKKQLDPNHIDFGSSMGMHSQIN